MGLSHFPSAAEGVLPVLVMNTLLSVSLLKSLLRSFLQIVGVSAIREENEDFGGNPDENRGRERRVLITQFKSLRESFDDRCSRKWGAMECCVCLSRFEEEEEVSELSCKHFFHRCCLEKWFDKNHLSCPLCRSVM